MSTASLVMASWVPAMAVLFRVKGPRLAVPLAAFAGFVFLPREGGVPTFPPLFEVIVFNKQTISGLALLVGILASDHRTLLRARPRPVDLPMIAFVLLPLASLAANGFSDALGSLRSVWLHFAAWSLPYLSGRLYLGAGDGPRRVSITFIAAGLVSVPICAFEAVMGPKFYLLGLLYGIEPYPWMVDRLGGYRPEGFLTHGIEFAAWMALSATTATWFWLFGGWRVRGIPGWLPALALVIASISCRGVYGYILLGLGLAAAFSTWALRTRVFLVALALVAPTYLGARISGLWDGRGLIELVKKTERGGTVIHRLLAEDSYLRVVRDHGPLFGLGGKPLASFGSYNQTPLWPDGWWIYMIYSGGIVGVIAGFLALFVIPVASGLALPAGGSGRDTPGALAWGLALFLILHMIDSLHNASFLSPTPLIGGSLVGVFLRRREIRPDQPPPDAVQPRGRGPSRAPLVIAVVVLATLEVLGRAPRPRQFGDPRSSAPEGVKIKDQP